MNKIPALQKLTHMGVCRGSQVCLEYLAIFGMAVSVCVWHFYEIQELFPLHGSFWKVFEVHVSVSQVG